MIELNLLPKELRKKKKPPAQLPRIPVLPIAAGVAVVLVVMHILFVLFVMNNNRLSRTLKAKWEQIQPEREKTESIARETNALQRRITAVKEVSRPEISWARLLSGLSQAMIPNVWLSDFELKFDGRAYNIKKGSERPTTLILTGYALGKSEAATTAVAKLINSLKRDKDFSEYFADVELQDMRTHEIAGEEAMAFSLACDFKKQAKPVKPREK
ncbi:MAG: hypothetical protein ABID83_03310 [Candidatus Omnitrophota bacterium]